MNSHSSNQNSQIKIQKFAHPSVLKQIGQPRLALFFSKFADDLQAAHIELPDFSPDNDEYFVALAALLVSPTFPPRPQETLARIELIAEPENVNQLNDAITRYIPYISLDYTQPAIDRALELWFHRPNVVTALFDSLKPKPEVPAPSSRPVPLPGRPIICPVAPDTARQTSPAPHDSGGPATTSTVSFPRWCDQSILARIGNIYIEELLQRFEPELAASNIALDFRCLEFSARLEAYAAIFSHPERLPQALVEALLAIQEFASPQNEQLCEKLAASAHLDSSHEPEGWALRLWLKAPYDLQYIRTLQVHLPATFYDDDIVYADPDENEEETSAAPDDASPPTAALPPQIGPAVEINPAPRNKIARLPKPIRDSINQLLGQGLTFAEILQQLGDTAPGLNKSNLSRWKRGPHQAWLKHQQRLEENGGQLKFALEAVRQNENYQIHEATQQIAALRISELFTQLDMSTLREAVIADPTLLARLAHLLPKLSQAGMECERVGKEMACAQSTPPPSKPKVPVRRSITNKTVRHLNAKLNLR